MNDAATCDICGDRVPRYSRTTVWCNCGRLVSTPAGFFVDFP